MWLCNKINLFVKLYAIKASVSMRGGGLLKVDMQGAEVVKVTEYKYLRSTIQSDGQCIRECNLRFTNKTTGSGGDRVEDAKLFIGSD